MEELFGIVVGLFVFISVIIGAIGKATGNTGNNRKSAQSMRESVLRAMELELEAKEAKQIPQPLRTVQSTAKTQPEKPIYEHSTDECTGGSIHDGYHEGTVRRPAAASSAEGVQGAQGARRASYAPGRTGQGMQGREGAGLGASSGAGLPTREELLREVQSKLAYEKASASHSAVKPQETKSAVQAPQKSGIEKLTEALSGKPPIVQGVMWAEILGRPLSDN